MREKLDRLSLEELRELSGKVGIRFTIGNDNILDKDEFILVLDEADKNELMAEYKRIAGEQ